MILTIVLLSAKYWRLLAEPPIFGCPIFSWGQKKQLPAPERSENSNFFLKNAKFSYQRRWLRPALLFLGVNTCNSAKLSQKRTIFKRVS